jgi:hypothetical protein
LLSSLFDLKWMTWFIIINLVAALLVTVFFLPQVKEVDLLNARAGLLTIGLFVLLFAWHRGNLEHMRLEEVARAQTELQQSNLELQNAQREINVHFSELRLAAQVGRAISQVHDLNILLKDACELILKEFNLSTCGIPDRPQPEVPEFGSRNRRGGSPTGDTRPQPAPGCQFDQRARGSRETIRGDPRYHAERHIPPEPVTPRNTR